VSPRRVNFPIREPCQTSASGFFFFLELDCLTSPHTERHSPRVPPEHLNTFRESRLLLPFVQGVSADYAPSHSLVFFSSKLLVYKQAKMKNPFANIYVSTPKQPNLHAKVRVNWSETVDTVMGTIRAHPDINAYYDWLCTAPNNCTKPFPASLALFMLFYRLSLPFLPCGSSRLSAAILLF